MEVIGDPVVRHESKTINWARPLPFRRRGRDACCNFVAGLAWKKWTYVPLVDIVLPHLPKIQEDSHGAERH